MPIWEVSEVLRVGKELSQSHIGINSKIIPLGLPPPWNKITFLEGHGGGSWDRLGGRGVWAKELQLEGHGSNSNSVLPVLFITYKKLSCWSPLMMTQRNQWGSGFHRQGNKLRGLKWLSLNHTARCLSRIWTQASCLVFCTPQPFLWQ